MKLKIRFRNQKHVTSKTFVVFFLGKGLKGLWEETFTRKIQGLNKQPRATQEGPEAVLLPLDVFGSKGRRWSGKTLTSPLAQHYLHPRIFPQNSLVLAPNALLASPTNGLQDAEIKSKIEVPGKEGSDPRPTFWEILISGPSLPHSELKII